ncbi:kinase-like domain-containing protein [Podospora didyma]|uniref:non-specific serine/threonine protein kinase n=1 Tax=Podospora didyma TaxID=330526 RepID=A0AAE0NRG5_9PEZI|nr:kinase-like domain-containing protein [Podospora didyma]
MSSDASPPLRKNVYIPEVDLEDFEDYTIGGYHPTIIGDTFHDGRYEVVHKLGFGGYSTVWLARDNNTKRYVSLKILVAHESSRATEASILELLSSRDGLPHKGQRFIPLLLNQFSFDGPNGRHICLVQEPAGCSMAASKEDSINFLFPVETARSIAAQLIMGVSYLHSRGVCHGDLHIRNFLLSGPNLDSLSPEELYERYRLDKVPITRVDGEAIEPHAPAYAVYPLHIKMAADRLVDPIVRISDYGTSFVAAAEPSPELHTPALYLPPEDFFNEPVTQAADIWTLGVNLYEVLGERPLFETFSWDRDDIMADMVSTLGRPPARWWDKWENREEFFSSDGSWLRDIKRIYTPGSRPLIRRMWDMGRGETPEACQWDVEGGEMRALEDLLRGMLKFEPAERLSAEQLMTSEYMVKWAMPAWERQLQRETRSGLE